MILKLKADTLGMVSSGLCLVHCIATPFLFLARTTCSHSGCADAPMWWRLIDYLFLAVSFIAIYHAITSETKTWMRFTFWGAWVLLFLAIINETFEVFSLSELFVYLPALFIIGLHFYNHKYCKCAVNDCCINQNK